MLQEKYTAFISYRHQSPDAEIAKKLHTLIESYRIPARIAKDKASGRRMGRVFRDSEELPLSPDLGKDIENALDSSEWFIAVCSPRYLESLWCMRELEYFLEKKGREHILTILVEGEPKGSFPRKLVFAEDGTPLAEPLAADVRGPSLRKQFSRLKNEKLRLLAPMLGVKYDELYRRQTRRRIRDILLIAGAAVAALGAFLVYAFGQNARIREQRDASVSNEMQLLISQADTALSEGNRLTATDLLVRAAENRETIGPVNDELLSAGLEQVAYRDDFSKLVRFDSSGRIVYCRAFSADDSLLVGTVNINGLIVFDTHTGKELFTVTTPVEEINDAGFTGDDLGVYMVDTTRNSVTVYDRNNGTEIRTKKFDIDQLFYLQRVYPLQGSRFLLVAERETLIWDYLTGEETPFTQGSYYWHEAMPTTALSADKTRVALMSVSYTDSVIADMETGEQKILQTESGYGYSFPVFSADGSILAAKCGLDHYTVWNTKNGKVIRNSDGFRYGSPDGIILTADGSAAIFCSEETTDYDYDTGAATGITHVWAESALTGKLLWETTMDGYAGAFALSSDGRYLCSTGGVLEAETGVQISDTGSVFISHTGTTVLNNSYGTGIHLLAMPGNATARVQETAWDQPGTNTPRWTDQETLTVTEFFHQNRNEYGTFSGGRSMFQSPDCRWRARTTNDGYVEIVSLTDERRYGIAEYCYMYTPWDVVFHGDLVAVSGGMAKRLLVFDLEAGRTVFSSPQVDTSAVMEVDFSPDGRYLVAAYGSFNKDHFDCHTIGVWSVRGGHCLFTLSAGNDRFIHMGFSPDSTVAVGILESGGCVTGELYTTLDELIGAVE